MAAALPNAPFTLRSRSPATMARLQSNKRPRISFSASFPSLKLHSVTAKKAGKRRTGGGGVRMADSAAERYASALADVAKSNGTLEATSADVERIEKIFSDREVSRFFVNPIIGIEKKREIIDEIAALAKIQPHTENFLNILIDARRMDLMDEIVKEFEREYNKLTGTELAVVSSVVKLESQHLAQIAKGVQRLTGAKNVRIKTVIDPSLVAGFTIRYGNSWSKLIDMSVKKQLDDIATELDFAA